MKKRNLLLVVFSVAILALCGCAEKDEVNNKKDDITANNPTQVALTNMKVVEYIKYTDNTTTVTLVKTDGMWRFENDAETWLSQEKVQSIEDAAGKLIALDVVDDAGALKDYGLDKPTYTVEVKDAEGNVVTIYVGNASSDTNYYATIGDKKEVYIINSRLVAALEFNQELLKEEFEDDLYEDEGIMEDVMEDIVEEEITEDPIEEDTSSETEE